MNTTGRSGLDRYSSTGSAGTGNYQGQQDKEKEKPRAQLFKAGDRVHHNIFGNGIILKSEMEGGTEFVEVQFQGKHGKKRLSLDFAKLDKI